MKRRAVHVLSIVSLVSLFSLAGSSFADGKAQGLVKEKEIELAGAPSFDLLAFDSGAGRLYVAHATNVDVVDVAKGQRVGVVEGVDGAHGVAVVPDLKRGFAAAGKKDRLVVFDLETLKSVKEVATGEKPDGVLYVAATKEVWAFNGKTRSATCVDATSLEVTATIALEGKPELAVEDAAKGLVYVNLEDKSVVCAIDAKAHKVVATHPVAPGEGPTGIAFDAKNALLFVGCGNKKLVALDAATFSVVASLDIGERCDGATFDPGTQTVFASCRGATSAFREKDAKTFEALPALETPGGKTCVLDAKTHRLFVASGPRFGASGSKTGEQGTVKVTVFAPGDPAAPAAPGAPASTWTGQVEKQGPSIHMEGTHRLVDGERTVVLLRSASVDLSAYEGKKVTVVGRPAPTVEGNQTIVDVDEVREAK